jgi:hypothetical protein
MENKTKIISFILLCIFILFTESCENKSLRNPNLFIKTQKGNCLIKTYDSVFIKEVTVEGMKFNVKKIIDFGTFDFLYK